MNWKWHVGAVLGLLLLLPLSSGAATGEAAAEALPPIEAGSAPTPEKKSKLRFKRGPTCMCVRGTSEEEIREAEEKRSRSRQ